MAKKFSSMCDLQTLNYVHICVWHLMFKKIENYAVSIIIGTNLSFKLNFILMRQKN